MVLWVLLLPQGKFGNKDRRKTMGSPSIRIHFFFFEREIPLSTIYFQKNPQETMSESL